MRGVDGGADRKENAEGGGYLHVEVTCHLCFANSLDLSQHLPLSTPTDTNNPSLQTDSELGLIWYFVVVALNDTKAHRAVL